MRGVERGKERGKGEGEGDDRANQCQEHSDEKMKDRNGDVTLEEVGRTNGRQPGVILIATVSELMVSVAFVLVQ